MASGSYFPKPVRQAMIPKTDGTKRALGIPTVVDRVAQMVVTQKLEKLVDKHFSASSFGYRPGKSAHDAIERCRINCLRHSWVIDLDIKGFFDNIGHELMMLAVKRFTQEKYILLYVERWLKAPVQLKDGTLKENEGKGTPQGGGETPLTYSTLFVIMMRLSLYNSTVSRRCPPSPSRIILMRVDSLISDASFSIREI